MKWLSAWLVAAFLPFVSAADLAAVSGRIVDAGTRQPVAGARVILARSTAGLHGGSDELENAKPTEQPQDPAGDVLVVLTGDDGWFDFRVTAPASFSLHVRRDGYAPYGDDIEAHLWLRLKAGERRSGIEITIERPCRVTGRVLDRATGQPVAGLIVVPCRWLTLGGSKFLSEKGGATSGNDGKYELKDLRPGDYVLKVQPPPRASFQPAGAAEEFQLQRPLAYLPGYYPGVERREEAQKISLAAGLSAEVDVPIVKRRGSAIRGCLHSDLAREQMGDVGLDLGSVETSGATQSFRAIASKQVSAGDCFRLDGLASGKYTLVASNRPADPDNYRIGITQLELDDQRLDGVVVEMLKPVAMHGKVTVLEGLASVAEKLNGMRVALVAEGRCAYGPEAAPPAEVSSQRTFELPAVITGSFRVFVAGLPHGVALGEVVYNGVRTGSDSFTLNPSAPGQQLEVVLAPATSAINAEVEGGAKASGWEIVLVSEKVDLADPWVQPPYKNADAEGRATFSGMAAGKYYLSAFPPGAAWRSDPMLSRQLKTGQEIDLAGDSTVTVEVKPGTVR